MTLENAQELFLSLRAKRLSPHTRRKYATHCRQFALWTEARKLSLQGITLIHLETFFAEREISQNTASKEIQFHKSFFKFCKKRELLPTNPAEDLEAPHFHPPENRPYTQGEIIRILAACDRVGQHSYERLRAKAAVLIIWKHALRISDVLALRRDAIQDGVLRLQARKNQRPIEHPVSNEVLGALGMLPNPISAAHSTARAGVNGENGQEVRAYFFWNGAGRFQNVMDNMQAILRQVYKLSGVQGAHNHRFRHTLVYNILVNGGTLEDAADALGITPQLAHRHYSKWGPERQKRLNHFIRKAGGFDDGPMSTGSPITHNFQSPADFT